MGGGPLGRVELLKNNEEEEEEKGGAVFKRQPFVLGVGHEKKERNVINIKNMLENFWSETKRVDSRQKGN